MMQPLILVAIAADDERTATVNALGVSNPTTR